MNREQTKQILTVLKANYPQSYKDWTKNQSETYLDLWTEAFKDDDVVLVTGAVKSIIYSDTRDFAPNIGQVKNMMYKLSEKGEMTEQEAWNLVLNGIRNGIYGSEKEFNKLPPILQRLVGSPGQLRSWALMDSEDIHTVVASNFMRSYKVRAKHEKELQAIPLEVKKSLGIETMSNQFKLEKKEKTLAIEGMSEFDIAKYQARFIASTNMTNDEAQSIVKFAQEFSNNKNINIYDVLNNFVELAQKTNNKNDVFKTINNLNASNSKLK